MLKIKDNVELKELEKFGFKKQPKPYLRILFMHSKMMDTKYIKQYFEKKGDGDEFCMQRNNTL